MIVYEMRRGREVNQRRGNNVWSGEGVVRECCCEEGEG